MKSFLIISFSDLKRDPRVSKQIRHFAKEFVVTTLGFQDSGIAGVTHLQVDNTSFSLKEKLLYLFYAFTGQYEKAMLCNPNITKALHLLKGKKFDIILANDAYAWPVAFEIKADAFVICDAHEYAPKEFEDSFKWRLLFQKLSYYLCKTYLPKADKVITVGEEIAKEFVKEFGIPKPLVMMNTPPFFDIEPSPVIEGRIRMIHHGGAIRSRKIENMIEMMNYLDDRFELNLMLIKSDTGYLTELKQLAASGGKKITFLTPIEMTKIVPYISQFDIGLYILEPNSFNNQFALPNKIFEFIQARLAIAIGPSPEMAHLVKKFNLGLIAETFLANSLAEKLNAITFLKIQIYKQNSRKAANELCYENELKKFDAILNTN